MRTETYVTNDWWKDKEPKDLVLSNDIDSLLSCAILSTVHPNWQIKYFFDFSGLYKLDTSKIDSERIWVDVAVQNGEKAFDNHVSLANSKCKKNGNMINPNFMLGDVTCANYYEKYCGSTAMMLWAIYDLPDPLTDEAKALLWNIDVGYKGLLHKEKYKNRFNNFFVSNFFYHYCIFERFSLKEWLVDNRDYDFWTQRNDLKLANKIQVDSNGRLQFDMDLTRISDLLGISIELPEGEFKCIEQYTNEIMEVNNEQLINMNKYKDNVISAAFTSKNVLNYSRRIS